MPANTKVFAGTHNLILWSKGILLQLLPERFVLWCCFNVFRVELSQREEVFNMTDILEFLKNEGIDAELILGVENFRKEHQVSEEYLKRIPKPEYYFYGKETWKQAIASVLAGKNILLAGPKATGKNVLADNLAALFGRPEWNVSFHINMDASYLIGTDTYDGSRVTFRPGPVYLSAVNGGFGVLDEINMAKNEALAVLHSALDYRHMIDVPGYDKIELDSACRFIATMNYGYAGTRELNEALNSRFVVISLDPIEESDLVRLIARRYPKMKDNFTTQFAKLFKEIDEKAQNAEISERALDLRGLLDAIGLIETGLNAGAALSMCIVNKTFDKYERKLIQDVIDARIPGELSRSEVFGN